MPWLLGQVDGPAPARHCCNLSTTRRTGRASAARSARKSFRRPSAHLYFRPISIQGRM
ncbi:hypothetical protein K788_0004805 [Paraburkholderia caribensis MBA4]|uniref:Uncharacterized protein n=1 Tax=Paraburkholderia caribensis MBA4 TaxID=1323664 RepID=A0A0P0R806_9BURK|nr:hypothetical protein K788_0004805 [Paraburkholderia caribensis MBA4]